MTDHDSIEILNSTDLFDEDWYVGAYPDVLRSTLSPQEHYLRVGTLLGRDPGPEFSTSCYLAAHPDVAVARVNPLVHYVRTGRSEGRVTFRAGSRVESPLGDLLPSQPTDAVARSHPGDIIRRPDRDLVLVVGHLAGGALFGAERSLLGLLDALDAIGLDTLVAIPSDENEAYVEELRQRSSVVYVMPVPARRPRRAPDTDVVREYRRLISDHGVAVVHVNTIVPREPLIAAREAGIPAVVHLREIPDGDPDLEAWLEAPADEIITSVLGEADYAIATSRAVADAYPLSGRIAVVPNTVDPSLFELPTAPRGGRVRVALVGSIQPKKGTREFVEIARLLTRNSDASFVVTGPASPHVHELIDEGLPSNVEFAGAADSPVDAMRAADIVVNLSNVSEGFGRTVLEAMTAGRPVVVFDRGGPPEFVRDGVCGFVVPAGDVTMFAHRVRQLVEDASLRHAMGEAGRRIAREEFSRESSADRLATAYRAILPSAETLRQRAGDVSVPLPAVNRSHFDRPFYVGNRARFAWCTSVAFAGPDLIVCASLLGKRLHLVRFDRDEREGEITFSLPTTDGTREVTVDLLDLDGQGRLVTSNCEHSTFSEYRIADGVIEYVGTHSAGDPLLGFCHGAKFVPGRPDVVCATTITGSCEAAFVSLQDGQRLGSFVDGGKVVKDVAFTNTGCMVVGLMNDPVSRDARSRHEAEIVLVAVGDDLADLSVLDRVELPGSTVDGCSVHGCLLFAASQSGDAVFVFDLCDNRLTRCDDLLGFSFPHDVAVSHDGQWLAVANYGTNDVQLRPMPAELLAHLSAAG